jgi:hypothetical protein
MQDLLIARDLTVKKLNECIVFYKNCGRNFGEARREYTAAWRLEVFKLHEINKVAWSACAELAKGNEEVAKLRLTKDIRKSDYDVTYEKILALKTEIRLIEGDMAAIRQGV